MSFVQITISSGDNWGNWKQHELLTDNHTYDVKVPVDRSGGDWSPHSGLETWLNQQYDDQHCTVMNDQGQFWATWLGERTKRKMDTLNVLMLRTSDCSVSVLCIWKAKLS